MTRTEGIDAILLGESVSSLCVRSACDSTGMFSQEVVLQQWRSGSGGLVLCCILKSTGKVNGFKRVQTNNYWSSTTNADNTSNAWNVNLNNGNVDNNDKTNDNDVWPVRGGE